MSLFGKILSISNKEGRTSVSSRTAQLDAKLGEIQRSTKTWLPALIPIHERLRQNYKWYYWWHLSPAATVIHITSLVFTVLLTVFILALSLVFSPGRAIATDYTISTNSTWCDLGDLPANIGNLTINDGVTLTLGGTTGNAVNGGNSGGTDACSYEVNGWTMTGTGTLTINGTGKIVMSSEISGASGYGITLNFASVNVTSSASIDANGKGFAGGAAGNNSGAGPGGGTAPTNAGGGGGGYGGAGGNAQSSNVGGGIYGTATAPSSLGSGGAGSGETAGGGGGGNITITVSDTLTVSGTISANGAAGGNSNHAGGGGSGGTIYITAGTIAGTGNITGNGGGGGSGGSNNGGGGGGGRVDLRYSSANTFSIANATVSAGSAGSGGGSAASAGSAGTAIFIDSGNKDAYFYKTFELDAASGLNSDLTNSSDGVFRLRNVTMGDGTNNATVITKSAGSSPNGKGPTLQLSGNFTLASGSTFSATGKGYAGGAAGTIGSGPGGGGTGNCGNYPGSGGGYGGAGGAGNSCAGAGGSTYGSSTAPVDLGSGGGGSSALAGANGGGAIKISTSSGTVTINGTLSGNGDNAGANIHGPGGGSGGSIYIITNVLAGSGDITVNGGLGYNGATTDGGSGGGGRLAINYGSSTHSGNRNANGGAVSGNGAAGSAGTVQYQAYPSAPTGLTTSAITSTTITWQWTDNSTTETGFKLLDTNDAQIGSTVASTTTAGTGTNYTLQESSLSINTAYTRKVVGIDTTNTDGSNGPASSSITKYTAAATPSAPTLGAATASTIPVSVTSGDGNPSSIQYAIQETSTGNYIQTNGTLGASEYWQTLSQWGTVTVSGLSSNTRYTFKVKARNSDNIETAFSASVEKSTLAVESTSSQSTSAGPSDSNVSTNVTTSTTAETESTTTENSPASELTGSSIPTLSSQTPSVAVNPGLAATIANVVERALSSVLTEPVVQALKEVANQASSPIATVAAASVVVPIAAASAASASAAGVSGFTFQPILFRIFQLFSLANFTRRKKPPWGQVKDAITGAIIQGAQVELVEEEYARVVDRTATDGEGRFVLLVSKPNIYHFRITAKGFQEYNSAKPFRIDDTRYVPKSMIVELIPLKHKISLSRLQRALILQKISKWGNYLRIPILAIGILLLVFALIDDLGGGQVQSTNLLIAVVYMILIGVEIRYFFYKKPYGQVIDSANQKPLGLVIMRAFRLVPRPSGQTKQLVATQVTDGLGRFSMLLNPGVYSIEAVKIAYIPYQSQSRSLTNEQTLVSQKIVLKRAK